MTKVTPENGSSLASQLRRVSLVRGVQASAGQEDRRQQRVGPMATPYAMKPNALAEYGRLVATQCRRLRQMPWPISGGRYNRISPGETCCHLIEKTKERIGSPARLVIATAGPAIRGWC